MLATCENSQLFKMGDSLTFSIKSSIKKIFMSPDKLVNENDPSSWVAKTKVAPVKFTK